MRQARWAGIGAAALVATLGATGPIEAACQNTGSFDGWLSAFRQEAAAAGLSQRTIDAALGGVTLDRSVIASDRRQGVFAQTFLEFSGRMVNSYRLTHGGGNLKKYASTFARIEQQFGVPGPVIASFWGLETDYGANIGNTSTLRSLATLAYDCRRPEEFRPQLLAALRIVERGDLSPREMISPWAGELGQTQFLPTVYYDYAVDYDGDGRRDLLRSVPDVLASTANYLNSLGWRAGEPWLEEVRVPSRLPWEEADVAIKHPRAQWAQWGVTRTDGGRLPADGLPASLLLPMGRNGPAFLAYRNFDIYLEWNHSLVYSTTAAYFATRLAGAPRVSPGGTVNSLSIGQVRELQQMLSRAGYDVGAIDGIIGEKTRAAVKAVQQRVGLPADSYPTSELLARLRSGG